MAWQVALVLDTEYSSQQIAALTHQMPVWAVQTVERNQNASRIRTGAGELWTPDPVFTLFTASDTDLEAICSNVLETLLGHHPHAACLDLIGVQASSTLTEILSKVDFIPAASQIHEGLAFRRSIEKLPNVHELFLDAGQWKTKDDVYEAFFEAVGSPPWHGKNFNALKDSIVTGDINKIEVPYRLVIENYARLPQGLSEFAREFVELIRKLENYGCPIAVHTIEGQSDKILKL